MSDSNNVYRNSIIREDLLIEATVKYWWQRRRFIISILLLSMVIFAGLLMLIPKSYKAQAAIIIMPPRFIPEIRTQPLTVLTARSLLETNELYQQVIVRLQRYRHVAVNIAGSDEPTNDAISKLSQASHTELMSDGRMTETDAEAISQLDETEIRGLFEFTEEELSDMTVDGIARVLSSEESVEKKTAADLTFSPVLQMFAISDTGSKAQVMVNLWARLFEEKYESLTRGQTQKVFESLENQQQAGQEELESIQKVLVDFKLLNNLELIQRQITDFTESFSAYHKKLVANVDQLVTLEAKIQSLEQLLKAVEGPNFTWIGSLVVDTKTTQPGSNTYLALGSGEMETSASDVLRRRRWEAVQSREDLESALDRAATYNRNNQIELMTAERVRLQSEYIQEKTDFRSNLVEAEVARKSLAELEKAVTNTSQSIPLMTGLPDEVLGDVLASGSAAGLNRVTSIQLNKEQLNPLWETLVTQRAEVSRSLNEAEATVAELSDDLPSKGNDLREMSENIFMATQGEKLVAARVQRMEQMNQTLYTDYVKMREEVFATGWQITMLKDEIDSLNLAVKNSRDDIERLRKSFEAASATLEIIELRKKAVQQRAELLTQKLQESMVAVREEVSDVSLASKAVAPTEHYFPPRSLLLLAMTLLTGGVLLGGMSRKRYRQLMAG